MSDRTEASRDRTDRDGAAGKGDMLGGLNAGAGDRLGIESDSDLHQWEPGPISNYQHTFDDVEPRTDSATNAHTVDELPAPEGA
jgi:hypothetical protein